MPKMEGAGGAPARALSTRKSRTGLMRQKGTWWVLLGRRQTLLGPSQKVLGLRAAGAEWGAARMIMNNSYPVGDMGWVNMQGPEAVLALPHSRLSSRTHTHHICRTRAQGPAHVCAWGLRAGSIHGSAAYGSAACGRVPHKTRACWHPLARKVPTQPMSMRMHRSGHLRQAHARPGVRTALSTVLHRLI